MWLRKNFTTIKSSPSVYKWYWLKQGKCLSKRESQFTEQRQWLELAHRYVRKGTDTKWMKSGKLWSFVYILLYRWVNWGPSKRNGQSRPDFMMFISLCSAFYGHFSLGPTAGGGWLASISTLIGSVLLTSSTSALLLLKAKTPHLSLSIHMSVLWETSNILRGSSAWKQGSPRAYGPEHFG